MKKRLLTISPGILIFMFIYWDATMTSDYSKWLLGGIYLFFPLAFIIQGISCSKSLAACLIGIIFSSVIINLSVEHWYALPTFDMVIPTIIYSLFALISFVVTNKFKTSKS